MDKESRELNEATDELNSSISRRVRLRRLAAGVTVRRLSEITGIKYTTLCNLENGRLRWSLSHVKSVSWTLDGIENNY